MNCSVVTNSEGGVSGEKLGLLKIEKNEEDYPHHSSTGYNCK